MFSYHIDVLFSYFKASYQSFLLNLQVPVKQQFYYNSFIRFIHSFCLSFFFLFCHGTYLSRKTRVVIRPYLSLLQSRFLCRHATLWGGALRDDTKNGCVGDLPYLDVDITTVCNIRGCHLYRSILSMMLTMFQSQQSFPLQHFLSPKLKFLHDVGSLSPCPTRSC